MDDLWSVWARSRGYRVVLVASLVYALLRLGVQGLVVLTPELFPDDLRIYLEAANRIRLREPLYPSGNVEEMEFYQYPPTYALAFIPFLWISPTAAAVVQTLFHLAVYGLLYVCWARIFRRLGMDCATKAMAWVLPVWLVFSDFWSDLGYLNVYILMALLATLLLDAVLNECLVWAVLWLSVILQIKPQWAFALAIPLLLGRLRFFVKLVVLGLVVYLAVLAMTLLIVGPEYGWEQYRSYIALMGGLIRLNYPWRTLSDGFLGYNHSIVQTIVYLLGDSTGALRLGTGIKILVLLPLGMIIVRYLARPARCAGSKVPHFCLDLAFALYLGAFIWLDVVWEVALSIAVFTYLTATQRAGAMSLLTWIVFLVYALVDLVRVATYVLFPDAIIPGPYILTDPSVYVPLTMMVIVTFYSILVRRLWTWPTKGLYG